MGLVEGVVSTRVGWLAGGEVVEVEFDPEVVSYEALLAEATRRGCAERVFPRTDQQELAAREVAGDAVLRTAEAIRPDDDTKYYLKRTPLRHLPLTPLQAARANGHVQGGLPPGLLSPSQEELLRKIEAAPDAGWPESLDLELLEAWAAARAVAGGA